MVPDNANGIRERQRVLVIGLSPTQKHYTVHTNIHTLERNTTQYEHTYTHTRKKHYTVDIHTKLKHYRVETHNKQKHYTLSCCEHQTDPIGNFVCLVYKMPNKGKCLSIYFLALLCAQQSDPKGKFLYRF